MSRWSSVAPTTGSGMPNEFAFDPGGVAERSRWSSVAPSGNATPRHAALRRDASSTALRSVLPVSGEMGSLTDGLAPGRGAAEEHRIAERCDEEYEIPSTWFAFVPLSCTLGSEIASARIMGREGKQAQSERGANGSHAMTVPAVLKGNQSGQG